MEALTYPEADRKYYKELLPQFAKIARGFMRKRPDPAIDVEDLLQEGIIMAYSILPKITHLEKGEVLAYVVLSYRRLLQSIYCRASARKRNPEGGFIRDNDETILDAVDLYGYRNAVTRVFVGELTELLTALDAQILHELLLADETAPAVIDSIEAGRGFRVSVPILAATFRVSPETVRLSIQRIRRVIAEEIQMTGEPKWTGKQ